MSKKAMRRVASSFLLVASFVCAGEYYPASTGVDTRALQILHDNFTILDMDTKRTMANTLIQQGVLSGVMRNGVVSDYPTGPLAAYDNAFLNELLKSADTVTATPAMLKLKEQVEGKTLDLENMHLATMRDIAYQHRFDEVKIINLAHNQLTEVPVPFFGLFKNAKKCILTGNPIDHLDTTYMPEGLTIIADYTQLASISSTTLHKNGYQFHIQRTPLAADSVTLTMLRAMCKPTRKSIIARTVECCFGKRIEQPANLPVSSSLITS